MAADSKTLARSNKAEARLEAMYAMDFPPGPWLLPLEWDGRQNEDASGDCRLCCRVATVGFGAEQDDRRGATQAL